jgi:hypothetical protein
MHQERNRVIRFHDRWIDCVHNITGEEERKSLDFRLIVNMATCIALIAPSFRSLPALLLCRCSVVASSSVAAPNIFRTPERAPTET